MALSGLEIYKLLPKTNCKKCGMATCLAFAMKLAAKKGSLDECPDVSLQARQALESASKPPIALVEIGTGDKKVQVGGETVLFRHEKTFYHPTALAVWFSDEWNEAAIDARLDDAGRLEFERVGQLVSIDMIAVENASGDKAKFVSALKKVKEKSSLALVIMTKNVENMKATLEICRKDRPLVYCADVSNFMAMSELAKQYDVPLAVFGNDLDELDKLSQDVSRLGVEDIVLVPGSSTILEGINNFTQIRRLALKKAYRPFGFPVLALTNSDDLYAESTEISTFICKYASIVIIKNIDKETILPILSLRQNIYTDPQKPVTVEPKLYEIGSPNENSPLMVTTNFSLTFYTVTPEIETSSIPSYLLVVDSEGMSVLTAWAADKFTPEVITDSLKKQNVSTKLKHRKIIIPGYVAVMSGKLEDLSGLDVMVGPKEASSIPKYLKEVWK